MEIVPQTKIAFVGFILLLASQLVFVLQHPNGKQFLPNLVMFIIMATLGLYVINCTVVGHCTTYAWISGYFVAALGVFAILGLIYVLSKK
jgi:hypothetical protein